ERKQAAEAEQKKEGKRAAPNVLAQRPAKAAKVPGGVVPEEYLPPNKTLLVRNMPPDYDQDMVALVFSRYPGFKEARLAPGREGIAFVEYQDEATATTVKEAMSQVTLGDNLIKVTFQRR
ncbi:hypothetical protein K470DRAFT_214319, partial [Piedraia hortae CBS 480.64]